MQIKTLGTLVLPGASAINNHQQLLLLLVYLAHQGETPRDHIARVFWPRASDARNSLSSALSRLRRLVPGAIVSTKRHVSTTATTDAAQLLKTRQIGPDPAALYQGVFLPSVDIANDQIELAEWISETRHQVTERVLKLATQFPAGSTERRRLLAQLAADVDNPALATRDRHRIVDFLRSQANVEKEFIGRESMLEELADAVRSGSLTCIYGLRGSGKSALLSEFVHRAEQLLPEMTVSNTSLGYESDPDVIGRAIAKISGHAAPKSTESRPALILLDDVNASEGVITLLQIVADSGIAVVFVTLAKPRCGENSILVSGLDDRDATKLFVDRVNDHSPSDPRFELASVERVCYQVANNPLGVELLAAWTDVVPVEQIANLAERPYLLLSTPPGKANTIIDIVEPSILALDDRTRSLLASLSVLRGDFDSITAGVVAGADANDLEHLTDCALLHQHAPDCFRVHPLVAPSVGATLGAGDRSDAQQQLDEYLGSLLDTAATSSDEESAGQQLARLQVHAHDLDLAWNRAVDRRDWRWIDHAVENYTKLAGTSKSGLTRMEAVEKSLQAMEKYGAPASVRQRANTAYAVVASLIQLPTESVRAAIARASAIGPDVDPDAYLGARRALARALADEGQRGSAITVLAEALRAVHTMRTSNDYALARLDLAVLLTDDGKTDAVVELLKPAVADLVRVNDQRLLAQHLYCLARVQIGANGTEALDRILEAEAVIEPTDFYFRQALAVLRAYVHYANGAYERSLDHFEIAEGLAPDTAAEATLGKAKCSLRLGRYPQAGAPLRTGLRAALQAGALPDVLFTAIAVSDVALTHDQGDEAARALLKYAWDHPGLPAADYLAPHHEPDLFVPTFPIDRTLRLDEICELTLSTYRRIAESTPDAHHVRAG